MHHVLTWEIYEIKFGLNGKNWAVGNLLLYVFSQNLCLAVYSPASQVFLIQQLPISQENWKLTKTYSS